jgi:hypothetical protein
MLRCRPRHTYTPKPALATGPNKEKAAAGVDGRLTLRRTPRAAILVQCPHWWWTLLRSRRRADRASASSRARPPRRDVGGCLPDESATVTRAPAHSATAGRGARPAGAWCQSRAGRQRVWARRAAELSGARRRPAPTWRQRCLASAALVIEIVSPGDDSWKKLPFYAAHHVDEVLIVDPAKRSVDWFGLNDGEYRPIERSTLIDLGPIELAEQID